MEVWRGFNDNNKKGPAVGQAPLPFFPSYNGSEDPVEAQDKVVNSASLAWVHSVAIRAAPHLSLRGRRRVGSILQLPSPPHRERWTDPVPQVQLSNQKPLATDSGRCAVGCTAVSPGTLKRPAQA